MSEALDVKIFDPPHEKHFGDRGHYVHAHHDITKPTDKFPRIALSYVGYVVELGDVFEKDPSQEYDESEEPEEETDPIPYIFLPLDKKLSDPEVLNGYKHIGLHSAVRLMIYHAGIKIDDSYHFIDPENLDIATTEPDPATADIPLNSAQKIEEIRCKLVEDANDLVNMLLLIQTDSETELPEAA